MRRQFENFDDEPSEDVQLSGLWLADLRALPNFKSDDETLLRRIQKNPKAESMFATQQRTRQQVLEETGGEVDIIEDQLRVLQKIFSR